MSRGSLIRLAGLALLWGTNFLFIKVALQGLNPTQIAFARLALGAATLLAVVAMRRQRLPGDRRTWGHLVVAALVANALPYFLFAWAEQTVASNLAGVLNAATPLFTLALAYAVGMQRQLRADQVGGLVLGFAGVLVILAPWRAEGLAGSLPGQLAVLAASTSYAVSFVYMSRYLTNRGWPPLVLAAAQLSAAAVLMGLVMPITGTEPVALGGTVLANLLALGVLGTGAAYLLNYRLIQDEGSVTASTVIYFLPIVAVVAGFLFLSEPITWNLAAGTVVVLLGVALSQGRLRRSAAVPGDMGAEP